MMKTTLYLPDEVKSAVTRAAHERGVSEAAVMRGAIEQDVLPPRVRPRGGLFSGGESIADRLDDYLVGFGE